MYRGCWAASFRRFPARALAYDAIVYHLEWYIFTMKTTIDKAGRIVVPKALRDELSLTPGQELEIRAVDGRLEIETPPTNMWLERDENGYLVAATDREMPPLTQEMVRDVLEQIRR